MKKLFAPLARTGGSLVALAAALTFALPAQAQAGGSNSGQRDRPRIERVQARPEAPRPAVRAQQRTDRAQPQRAAPRGFGGDVARRVQAAQQQAQRIDQRSEQRARQADRRAEQQAVRVEQRGEQQAQRLERRGRDAAAERVERRSDVRADRIEQRGDVRADRIEQRGDRRADRVQDRVVTGRGGWQGDRRDTRIEQRDGRRDGWQGDRRDGQRADRRDWRQNDWRWGWNGRQGWDNRDFRRWDNRWRSNRTYNWHDYRRSNVRIFRPGAYYAPYRNHRYSRLNIGFQLDSLFFQPRFFINDPWAYRLPAAYGPYQWVRYYDDVLLVDIYTGEVVDVIDNFFW